MESHEIQAGVEVHVDADHVDSDPHDPRFNAFAVEKELSEDATDQEPRVEGAKGPTEVVDQVFCPDNGTSAVRRNRSTWIR